MALTGKINLPVSLSFHNPSTLFCVFHAAVREGGKAGGAAAGVWDWDGFRSAGFVPSSRPAQESLSVEIQGKIHLCKDAVSVLLTQVVQLTLVRTWNVTHSLWKISLSKCGSNRSLPPHLSRSVWGMWRMSLPQVYSVLPSIPEHS